MEIKKFIKENSHILCIFLFFALYIVLALNSPVFLTNDEPYYYFQGLAAKEFNFPNYDGEYY